MDIVIISEFCGDFSKSDNDRFLYLAKLLIQENRDNDVEIVTSSFHHTTKKHRTKSAENWAFKITFIEEPGYPQNICLKRFHSHHVWGRHVFKYLKGRKKKPDVIYCAVPSLTGPYLLAKYCEKMQIRFVIDVQDLWPEAFRMVFHMPVLSRIVFAPFSILADAIYKRADAICAVSDTYCQRAARVNKKVKDTTTVFLGTELSTFDQFSTTKPVLEKNDGEIWIAYCGTLGSSYDIRCVIDALRILGNDQIRLVVMGDGPMKEKFEEYAKEKKVKIAFVGRLKYDQMCSLLSLCDINVNPIVHMSAASIINKHADYAASGLPVVNTQENEEYRKLVDTYQMGFNCENNDPYDLANKIGVLIENKTLRIQMGKKARRCAAERFDRKESYKLLVDKILTCEGVLWTNKKGGGHMARLCRFFEH